MKILSQWSWRTVNKRISRQVGLEASLLLSDLCDKKEYFWNRKELIKYWWDEYFYNTSENIENDTTLSYRKQKTSIKILEKEWLIKTKLMWVPAKLHFSICEDKIWLLLKSSISETSKLDLAKRDTNNNKDNKNKEITITTIVERDGCWWETVLAKTNQLIEVEIDFPLVSEISKKGTFRGLDKIEKSKVINFLSENLEKYFAVKGIVYEEDRNFLTHLMSKKMAQKYQLLGFENLFDFCSAVIEAAQQPDNRWNWKINSARSIYKHYAKVLNSAKAKHVQENTKTAYF